MTKKTKKKNKFEGKSETLHETRNPEIDKLVKIYKQDRFKARVVYMNGDKDLYSSHKLMLFTLKNGDFNMVLFKKTFGINKINVMYSNESRVITLVYKGGKFHKIVKRGTNSYVQQITFLNLTQDAPWEFGNVIKKFFIEKFTWLRHMDENHILLDMAFNSIIDKKLFSLKKALVHKYKVPYPVAKIFHTANGCSDLVKYVPTYLPYIKNIENFNPSWLNGKNSDVFLLFYDSIKMGRILDKQVNCSWSEKRLKEEHDKWSNEISDIVFTHDNREMNVGQIYKDFHEFSKLPIITTTREMAMEGKKQNHCVASYVSSVDTHSCGIFKVGEYTLELKKRNAKGHQLLILGQIRGFGNKNATENTYKEVVNLLADFNKKTCNDDYDDCIEYLKNNSNGIHNMELNELPF